MLATYIYTQNLIEDAVQATYKYVANPKKGQGLVEYALILALVAVAVIVAITALGGGVSNKFNQVKNNLG